MTTLAEWLGACVDEDEVAARAASGGTVVGMPGRWSPAPGGDEWEAHRSSDGDEELLVALRPGLPRPPDVMGGYWGAVASRADYEIEDRGSWMPVYEHMARHDPARALAEVAFKRVILAGHAAALVTWREWEGSAVPGSEARSRLDAFDGSLRAMAKPLRQTRTSGSSSRRGDIISSRSASRGCRSCTDAQETGAYHSWFPSS